MMHIVDQTNNLNYLKEDHQKRTSYRAYDFFSRNNDWKTKLQC